MHKKALTLFLVLITSLVAGMFVFAYMRSIELRSANLSSHEGRGSIQKKSGESESYVNAKDYFSAVDGGTHTLMGNIILAAPCDFITYSTASQNDGQDVRIRFDTYTGPSNGCAAPHTGRPFTMKFKAQKDARINAYLKDQTIPLRVVLGDPKELSATSTSFE